jgi:hypothetical protein
MLFRSLEEKLRGWPDTTLTIALVIVAIVALITAWRAPTTVKGAVLVWVLLP